MLGSLLDPAVELVLRDERGRRRASAAGLRAPEPVDSTGERRARLGQRQRADEALSVVGMHRGRGGRVPLGQTAVRGARVLVDSLLHARQRRLVNCGRELEIREGCAEVEPRARPSRRPLRARRRAASISACASGANSPTVICSSSERIPTSLRVRRRLVREDRQAAVHLQRVDGYHLGPEPRRRRLCDGALARGGRAEDREHLRPVLGGPRSRPRRSCPRRPCPARRRRSGHRPPPHASSLTPKRRRMSDAFVPGPCRSLHTEARASGRDQGLRATAERRRRRALRSGRGRAPPAQPRPRS